MDSRNKYLLGYKPSNSCEEFYKMSAWFYSILDRKMKTILHEKNKNFDEVKVHQSLITSSKYERQHDENQTMILFSIK